VDWEVDDEPQRERWTVELDWLVPRSLLLWVIELD
jgi:hypothetical protein